MSKNALLKLIGYASLIILIALDLLLRYDTWVRQIALSVTGVFALLALLGLRNYMLRMGSHLPWPVVWFVALGVWFDAMGNFVHFYANIPHWDKLAHFVGTAAVTLGVIVVLRSLAAHGKILLGPKMLSLFAVSLAMTFSALYEISEYVGDSFFATHRVTSRYDTASDLLANLAGAVVLAFVAHLQARKTRPIAG